MDPTNAGVAAPVDAAGNVIRDVPCRKCSYNLRGLNYAGRCPECGTAVGQSIYGNLLRFSDPVWVDKLAKGVNLILWGIVAAIAAAIVGAVLRTIDPVIGQLIAFLGSLVGLAGAWLLTEPDPGTQEDPSTLSARRIVRFALLVGVVQTLLTMFMRGGLNPTFSRLLGVIVVVAAIVGVIGQFAQIYYLEKLALRIPDDKLAARARLVRWGYGVSLAVVVVLGAIVTFSMLMTRGGPPGGGGTSLIMVSGCLMGIAGLTLLVFGIIYLIMLFQFNRVLKEQAEYARRTWAVMNAPAGMAPPPVTGQA